MTAPGLGDQSGGGPAIDTLPTTGRGAMRL